MNENLRNSESLLQLTTLEMSQVERTSLYMSNLELSEKDRMTVYDITQGTNIYCCMHCNSVFHP